MMNALESYYALIYLRTTGFPANVNSSTPMLRLSSRTSMLTRVPFGVHKCVEPDEYSKMQCINEFLDGVLITVKTLSV